MRRIALLLLVSLAASVAWADEPRPVRLIFDTDMMGDVDDVGTVAVLHALADQGEVQILAMGLSGKHPWSPLCLDALNVYYGRPGIPIGVVKGPAFDRKSRYAETIAKEIMTTAGARPPTRPWVRRDRAETRGPRALCRPVQRATE